jgi:hypothetical protein
MVFLMLTPCGVQTRTPYVVKEKCAGVEATSETGAAIPQHFQYFWPVSGLAMNDCRLPGFPQWLAVFYKLRWQSKIRIPLRVQRRL